MAIRKSGISGIPFGNTAARPASPSLGQPYFNGEVGRLELYSSTGWQNIIQETPGVASASGTYNQSAGSGTFTISGTNFVDGAIAYAVGTNGTEYQATTTTYNSLVQLTVVFSSLSPEYEPYDIKVTNPSNLFGLLPDAFYINDSPVWSTTAGSLGTWAGSNIQLSATDDESNTITYTVTSGSLPTGLSVSSAGLISGTATANPGTYTFTVSASDGINTAVTRSFSILVPTPSLTGGTLTSDSTYYYRTFTGSGSLVVSNGSINMDILSVAGGGGGGGSGPSGARYGAGGGGAGGLVYTSSSFYSAQTYSIQVGAGGAGGTGAVSTGNGTQGINSRFGSLTAAVGGGYGGSDQGPQGSNGGSGGSGGGGGPLLSNNSGFGGTGTSGQGNDGGNSSSPANGGGGGGGAGSVGNAGTNATGGNGGSGVNTYSSWATATSSGASGFFASGGGGGVYQSGTPGSASTGGGGGGGNLSSNGVSGTSLTGGGGGGASGGGSATTGGNGGSGIVIVRYTKASVGG
jgi:hypothetical protein